MIKEFINLTGPEKNKNGTLRTFLFLMVISMQKIYGINRFLAHILMIKQSCNRIKRQTQLATPKQKR